MADPQGRGASLPSPRSIALIGPQGSGKSALFDALLAASSSQARRSASRPMGNELRIGHRGMQDGSWAILDCPGSIEFSYDVECALAVVDLAVVVCEAAPARAGSLGPLLRRIEETGTPALVFLNKIDALTGTVREALAALQAHTRRKLVLRQVPIREGEMVTGYVDLVSERSYRYRRGEPSERIALPESMQVRKNEARGALLELLADHDDALLEKVLEDLEPEPAEIYRPLHHGEGNGAVVSVLLGAAEHCNGIQRLWKALRHDVPSVSDTAARHGITLGGPPLALVFRTLQAGHAGRLSFVRLWRGKLEDGAALDGQRVGGIYRFPGGETEKVRQAEAGDIAALGRLEGARTGATLGGPALPFPEPPPPVFAMTIAPEERKDEVRLSTALQRLTEEDPALTVSQDAESGATILAGQGEIHLRAALDRLSSSAGVKLRTARPPVAYRETIRHAVVQQARLKRQTGGHGQFADVKLQIAPRPRGAGFHFDEKVVGGAVPKRFIPAVSQAAEEAARKGPLGHPVVDVAVTLLDGGFHAVDSSDMAFATATRMAMQEGLAKADPVQLEPVDEVTVTAPAEFTSTVQRLLTGRRGQILSFTAKAGWEGWDEVQALVPASELGDFIIELRSQTQGLGTYGHQFNHLAEMRGR
ncbi:elongation factor G [Roseomonas xinghualingensis]|uniref:elongation factor G n=1 Tax=Roseomonas xinghualingensis TaxID=2986475 RepID=UPI0021F1220D|nr:elongation factor G [Roseomonas sp. SXEYE001]MCV4206317.1 elongation factor G [Roseomonas sp. SXEYE001]